MPVKRSATRERKIRTHASVDLAIVEVAETFDTAGSTVAENGSSAPAMQAAILYARISPPYLTCISDCYSNMHSASEQVSTEDTEIYGYLCHALHL